MANKRYLSIAIFFFSYSIMSIAQQTISLSLDSCIIKSLSNSYDLQSALITEEKAIAENNAITTVFFPKIGINAIGTYVFKNVKLLESPDFITKNLNLSDINIPAGQFGNINIPSEIITQKFAELINQYWNPVEISLKGAYMAGISLLQPIFVGGQIVNGKRMGNIGVKMAKENIYMSKQDVIYNAQKLYWLYVSINEKHKVLERYLSMLEELENTVKNAKELDMVNQSDLLKIKTEHSAIKLKLSEVETGQKLSEMALCNMIGVDLSSKIIASDTTIGYEEEPNIEAPQEIVKNRPEYKLLHLNSEMKNYSYKSEIGKYLPTIGMGLSFGYLGGIKINEQRQNDFNTSNISISIYVPISHWWEGAYKIKSAKSDYMVSKMDFLKNTNLMVLQINQAIFALENAKKAIEVAKLATEEAKESLRISKDRYSVGMETLTELLYTRAKLQEAESNLIDAKINFKLSIVEYQKVTGQLKDQYTKE